MKLWKKIQFAQSLPYNSENSTGHITEAKENFSFSYQRAAVTLQRAWKLNQYKKYAKKDRKSFTEESFNEFLGDDLYQQCKKLNVTSDPQSPSGENTIDRIKAAEWIAAHPEYLQPMAKIVVKHIQHVPFNKFQHRLHHTVREFNKKLMQLPEENRQYFIILGQTDELDSSNTWVLSMAFQSLVKAPVAIIPTIQDYSENVFQNFVTTLRKHPCAKMALYLDDAIYSGTQVVKNTQNLIYNYSDEEATDKLQKLLSARHFIIYIGVPYITFSKDTYNRINNISRNISILPHSPMLLLETKLTRKGDQEEYKKTKNFIEDFNKLRTFTYFAHKVADFVSIPRAMTHGRTLNAYRELYEKQVRFIPSITPPYRKI